jgi:hypothetical protein
LGQRTDGNDGFKDQTRFQHTGFDCIIRKIFKPGRFREPTASAAYPLQVEVSPAIPYAGLMLSGNCVSQVPGMTVGQYKLAVSTSSRTSVGDTKLWTGTRIGVNHSLTLEQRPDRNLLLSLKEQSRQVLQVRVNLFGPLPDPQPAVLSLDVPALKAARDFMVPICEAYAAGTIKETTDLAGERDKQLEALGLSVGRKPSARKRPAAAEAAEPEPAPKVAPPTTPAAKPSLRRKVTFKTPPPDLQEVAAATPSASSNSAGSVGTPASFFGGEIPMSLGEMLETSLKETRIARPLLGWSSRVAPGTYNEHTLSGLAKI